MRGMLFPQEVTRHCQESEQHHAGTGENEAPEAAGFMLRHVASPLPTLVVSEIRSRSSARALNHLMAFAADLDLSANPEIPLIDHPNFRLIGAGDVELARPAL